MKRRRHAVAALAVPVVLATAAFGAVGCGDDGSGAGSADTCDELVHEAAIVAAQIVDDLRDTTSAELDPGTDDDPYPELTRPFAAFEARAEELGCDRGELQRLACTAYDDIEASGPAAEEFLAAVDSFCP